jgi:hypothetical protein
MSLMFGHLTNAFVDFGRVHLQQLTNPDPDALARAGKKFRDEASKNALYVVYIGV